MKILLTILGVLFIVYVLPIMIGAFQGIKMMRDYRNENKSA